MQKWEYLEVKNPTIESMNALGDEGWELVATAPFSTQFDPTVYYIFKRPKQ